MILTEDEYLAHYGTPRKSGRYPWGSGDDDLPRNPSFLDQVEKLKRQGLSEATIAEGLGLKSTTQLRARKRMAKAEQKQEQITTAMKLKEKQMSNIEIGKQMGINESSVRLLLAPGAREKADSLDVVTNLIRDKVDSTNGFIEVGVGVERHLNMSKDKLATAVQVLQEEGYELHKVQVQQLGTTAGQKTTSKVICPPGTTYKDVVTNLDKVQLLNEYISKDGGGGFVPPLSIDSKRVAIKYGPEGGATADGVLHVRPGVSDVSLGGAPYAQVRVKVDGTHYIKGMAVYKEDLPAGVDIVFNTNKKSTGNKLDALKKLQDDPDNPFGAVVDQIKARDSHGKEYATSAMNKVNEAGDWDKWSRSLSSQTLSKQSPRLAKTQLDMTYEKKKNALDEINRLTNPAVKKKLLESFALETDAAAVHLKAAALPRSSWHVILPMDSMKDTHIFAPNFKDGETVALVRYPHGGPFEIPELTVNNKHRGAIKLIGKDAKDAVVINSKIAERLSGADFDGDAVLVIPNNNRNIKTKPPLAELEGFDPRALYKNAPGATKMTPRVKGIEMGLVSNLITDMTIQGAGTADLSRAIRHSMVVIDAENHDLDWRRSAKDFNISQLKAKYQAGPRGGAYTLISRKKTEDDVPVRKLRRQSEGGPIDPKTGKLVYVPTGESYVNKQGKTVFPTQKVRKLAETDDARTLMSGLTHTGTPIERVYADHSNRLKALANTARREYVKTPSTVYSPSAAKVYDKEVKSLNYKLNVALRNAPLERQAQLIANVSLSAKKASTPDLTKDQLKKLQYIELTKARNRVGANKERIEITPHEWAAIQAGAVSNHRLTEILRNTDVDKVKVLATPKVPLKMTATKRTRAAAMIASGFTQAEVAEQLGVSLTTLKTSLSGEED